MPLERYEEEEVGRVVALMREEARSVVTLEHPEHGLTERGSAFMRYIGQGHEISVPFDPSTISQASLRHSFEDVYQSLYGRLIPEAQMEVLSWTLNVSASRVSDLDLHASKPAAFCPADARRQELTDMSGSVDSVLLERKAMSIGQFFGGPVLVTERHTTTVVPTGYRAKQLPSGHLLIERENP